jgi:3-oxoisoapionate kinase
MTDDPKILLAFYGDDLTGSTDALESICRAGAKAILFLQTPTLSELQQHADIQAYGVAGSTRSLATQLMKDELIPAFTTMKEFGARHIHYKVCSTFDSSPQTGSIGEAIECGAKVFKNVIIPILGGTPSLGRYCVFGNLFARMGTVGWDSPYRLDRHPSMIKHPSTPATESDLGILISKQTDKSVGLIDVLELEGESQNWNKNVQGKEVVLIDTLYEEQLSRIGFWMDAQRKEDKPLFSVGSSSIEVALGKLWNKTGELNPKVSWPILEPVGSMLILSGSCSPVTKNQTEFAIRNGFTEFPLELCARGERTEAYYDLAKVIALLKDNQGVIIHTGNITGIDKERSAEILGNILGEIGRKVCDNTPVQRVVIAGGDTSSFAARAMGVNALELFTPFLPGAPLCKAYAPGSSLHDTEMNFKGGQVGGLDYFIKLKEGKTSNSH